MTNRFIEPWQAEHGSNACIQSSMTPYTPRMLHSSIPLRLGGVPNSIRASFVAALFVLLVASPISIAGQERTPGWEFETELGGSLYFGNRPQSQFSTTSSIDRISRGFDAGTKFRFTVAVAEDSEGEVALNRRSWGIENTLGLRPNGTWQPFLTTRLESSFERRIDLRYDGGVGIRVDHQTDRHNRTEFSIALLAERTFERGSNGADGEIGTLARWYSDMRVRRTFIDNRVALDLRNNYRPVFDAFGNYTLSSQNAVTFGLNDTLGFRFNLRGDFDSRAKDRGARTNLDTQVTFSVVATF